MGRLLERAFAEAAKLPETEQEAIAALVLAELDSEQKWDDLFAKSQDLLSKLAREARDEYRSGQTEPLDPDKL
jgi:predicted amidophosphoribosyltransferase